jgi:ABC-type phosphate/phosphonate transport system ATPase subunit
MVPSSHSPVVPGAPWAIVVVMGVTGAGKSTFIKAVSGDDSVVVGNGMKSCTLLSNDRHQCLTDHCEGTSELKGYCFYHDGYNVNLVDRYASKRKSSGIC